MKERTAELVWEQCINDYLNGAKGPSEHLMAQLDLIREESFKNGVHRAVEAAASWARNYPCDIFPPDGTSEDSKAAAFARHTTDIIVRQILELLEVDC
jgi:hypothetical protein